MSSTPPCGIGGSQSSDGECTGTYVQLASQAGAHVFDGITSSSVVLALIAAAALLAAVVFTRWVVSMVSAFFDAREAERLAREAEQRAADRHLNSYRKGFDFEDFGEKLHEAGGFDDDGEDDVEDDMERDDALEYDGERRE